MHVLVTADTVGGVWTYARELTCGLLARGHKVTLVSFGKLPKRGQTFWLKHKNLTYYATEFPLEWMQDAESGIAESTKHLERVIYDSRPDVLHFSQYCYGSLDFGIPNIVVAHSDVLSWWNAVHGGEPPESNWMTWYRNLVAQGLRNANVVVAPSQWMLDTLRDYYELPSTSCVIYNGRSGDLFRAAERKQDCVLSVGRIWDEAKQVRLLLSCKQCVPVRIAGSAQHPENGESYPLNSELASSFRFCGEQDETQLRELYADSAAYAATSRYEPFGLAPVEAALSRCALILNDIPVFRELWGDAAFYFDRDDANSLAQAISVVSEFSSLRRLLGDLAYERARTQFESQRMIRQYEELYSSLVGRAAA